MGSRLNYDDYTVAWIAVLPIEVEAALAVLDKRHDGYFESSRGDDYSYIGGEVNSHKVVVATLPVGQDYGVGSAAALASQVKARFPRLWFALLVGVAAGVPNLSPSDSGELRDIRLGDVLVSVPSRGGSGIIHYDLGKDTEQGFLPNGRQAEPPAIVRAAIGNIQLTQKRPFHTGNQLAAYLTDVQSSTGDGIFLPPSQETDLLYARSSAALTSSTPSLVIRQPRTDSERTRVWYGNIGSGNSLMRNAKRRDELRDKYDLIGLEMEAAGVANILPLGVIRGVCDYGDAQKNKDWQPYAAAVAAVYTKGLLHAIAVQPDPVTKDIPPALWLVPFDRNDVLVGRQAELEKLETMLLVPNGPRKVALTGLGGIGKSRLALEFAYRTRLQRPSCSIIWIQGTDLANFERDCLRVGQALNVPQITDAKADVNDLLKQYLSLEKASEWLLIVDNADDLDLWTSRKQPDGASVVPLMDHIPSSSQGLTLITTRNHQVAVKMAKNNIVKLHELSEPDALSMIKSLLGDRSDIMDANPLASASILEHLSYLPLALVQAAAYILENDIAHIEDYLQLWNATEEAVVELLSEDFEDENRYPESRNPVAATWLISFEQMWRQNPLAADMLAFLACLDFKSIPHSLLPFQLFETGEMNNQMTKAMGILTGYTFLHREQVDEVDPVYNMHRLVHLATRNWLRDKGSLTRWSLEAAERMVEVFPRAIDDSKKDLWTLYMPHAEKILAVTALDDSEVSIELMSWMGHYYIHDGKYAKAVSAFRRVLSWRSDNQNRNSIEVLASFHDLARALERAGEYTEAETCAKRAVDGLIAVCGKHHSSTLEAMFNLAAVYGSQRRLHQSESLYSEVLESYKRTLGEEHGKTLRSREALANVYARKGMADKAEEHHRAIMDIVKRKLGAQHPRTITSMYNLAMTYQDQGRWDEAEIMQLAVLEAEKTRLGEEHPLTLQTIYALTRTYRHQGRLTLAEDMHTTLLETRKRVLGGDHPTTLVSMFNLAVGWYDAGRQPEAMALLGDTLELERQKLGEDHPNTMQSMHSLATWWMANGRNEDATVLMEECLKLRTQILGENHKETLGAMYELARMRTTAGRMDEAMALMEQCLEKRRQTLGENHEATLQAMHGLALICKDIGCKNRATSLMKECLEGKRNILGESHDSTLTSMHALAIMLYEGNRQEGVALMKECVKLKIRKFGESDKRTLVSKEWLEYWEEEATVLDGRGEWEKEEEEEEEEEERSDNATRVSDEMASPNLPVSTEQDSSRYIVSDPASPASARYPLPLRVGLRSTTTSPVGAIPGRLSYRTRQAMSSMNTAYEPERQQNNDQGFLEAEID